MNTAFICVCSDAYISKYRILYNSIIKYIPNVTTILYYTGETHLNDVGTVVNAAPWLTPSVYTNDFYKHCSIRPKAILDAFSKGYDKVFLMGADTEFFDYPRSALEALNNNEMFVTMYLDAPLPDDDKYHNNFQVLENGQIQADFIGFKNCQKSRQFLVWVDGQVKTKCTVGSKVMVDQVWLSMCFSFLDKVHICKDLGYNVGSYNAMERGLNKRDGQWLMKDNSSLCLYHYDGLGKGNETKVSKHQNRWAATGPYLEFLLNYTKKL